MVSTVWDGLDRSAYRGVPPEVTHMVGIAYFGNDFGRIGLDTDTQAFITDTLDGEPSGYFPDAFGVVQADEYGDEVGHGPFDRITDAINLAYDLYCDGINDVIVTTPDGTTFTASDLGITEV
jgi:hypothetical protein